MLDPILNKRPDIWRRIARGWFFMGLLGVGFVAVFTVWVYVLGGKVQDDNGADLKSHADLQMKLALAGVWFASFAIFGRVLLVRLRRRRQ